MIKVSFFDQRDTHFATFDLPELPRVDDEIEIGFSNEQVVKFFTVLRVVHQMIQIPSYQDDPPWRWEYRLHGILYDPKNDWTKAKCICAEGVTECPKHGNQPAEREVCPVCEKAVLGYCAQGEYCTSDTCSYAA